jgi:hypothetical protein
MWPNVRSLILLWPANTDKFHMPVFKSHLNMNPLNQNVSKQTKKQMWENNGNICITHISSFTIGTHNFLNI